MTASPHSFAHDYRVAMLRPGFSESVSENIALTLAASSARIAARPNSPTVRHDANASRSRQIDRDFSFGKHNNVALSSTRYARSAATLPPAWGQLFRIDAPNGEAVVHFPIYKGHHQRGHVPFMSTVPTPSHYRPDSRDGSENPL